MLKCSCTQMLTRSHSQMLKCSFTQMLTHSLTNKLTLSNAPWKLNWLSESRCSTLKKLKTFYPKVCVAEVRSAKIISRTLRWTSRISWSCPGQSPTWTSETCRRRDSRRRCRRRARTRLPPQIRGAAIWKSHLKFTVSLRLWLYRSLFWELGCQTMTIT